MIAGTVGGAVLNKVMTPSTPATPTKTSAQVQRDSEDARLRNPLSTLGFSQNFSGGYGGSTANAPVKGVTLGA